MQSIERWNRLLPLHLLLLTTLQTCRVCSARGYHRMSIAVNSSTVNPHLWYRQPPPVLPSWYTPTSNFRNYKVFHLIFLRQLDVRCNDGTRAGYYIRRSKNTNSRKWMIYLEGGWYCFDEATCISRQITNHALFSSRTWHINRYIGGVLSWDERINPNYHDYNTIFVPYCSSDLWSGKKSEPTGGYYFHGSRILTAVVDDLLQRPDAGGIGVMLNIDRLARRIRRGLRYRRWQLTRRIATNIQISGLVDSAWFLNYPTYAQPFSSSCTSIYDCPPEEGILPPIFIIQSLFDEAQLQMSRALLLTGGPYNKLAYIQNLGKAVAKSLDTVRGVFAPACSDHEILTTNHWAQLMVNSQSLQDTLNAWDAHLTRWRRYPQWYLNLRQPPASHSRQDSRSQRPQQNSNSSMIFLSKLVAVLNRPKTDTTAMRGGRHYVTQRTQRDLSHPPAFVFRAIDRCSLDAGPDDFGDVRSREKLAAACMGRSHITPLCNPSCRALIHPRTMEKLTVVSLYELYGVDSAQLAANIGVSVSRLKALPVKEQMRMMFCRRL
ncbi:unnamed protein product [Mesocestoides corti]|uniref:Uncharacterized protein n=1 Tax=Mesocestoides corti TaxID=53468 RepID=A0A0R3U7Q1_MESCO|nr:unnamed protein product [Mesocestoides corti]